MNQLYPLKFEPILKDMIWGGSRLRELLNKKKATDKTGESWEISDVEGSSSIVSNGFLKGNSLSEIIEIYMDDLVGNPIYEKFGNFFPLLIKFIDANDKLSVQVHPNDDLAFEEHGTFGKTEMWYIMQANEGAGLYIGFNKELNASELKKIIENNKIEEVLNFVPVKEGDVVFLPAGRIHAIGAGLLIAEIQQTSDITYRLYDWNRVDQNGKPRQLHIEQALKAIDYSFIQEPKINYQILPNNSVELVSCQYFTTNIIEVTTTIEKDYGYIDSFVVLICVKGKVMIEPYLQESVELNIGETILIPEEINNLYIKPFENSTLLEIYIK